jgi:hypothetical protein
MIPTTKLNLLYLDALDRFKRRIEEERVSLALEGDESIPSARLYELIRDVADESVPETDQGQGVTALLSLALENMGVCDG